VLWTGDVVVWAQPRAFAYDTTEGRWAPLPPLPELDRDVVATQAVADGSGLVVLIESIRNGDHVVTALRWDGAEHWSSLDDVELPVEDLDRTSGGSVSRHCGELATPCCRSSASSDGLDGSRVVVTFS
jgi:hypothetical protein